MPQRGAAVSGGNRVGYHDREHHVSQRAEPMAAERAVRSEPLPVGRGLSPERGGDTGVPGRRTVTIRGHGAERYVPTRPPGSRRRPERRYERSGFRPDRAALWAVLLGVMLILAAAMSAHAATLHAASAHLH